MASVAREKHRVREVVHEGQPSVLNARAPSKVPFARHQACPVDETFKPVVVFFSGVGVRENASSERLARENSLKPISAAVRLTKHAPALNSSLRSRQIP